MSELILDGDVIWANPPELGHFGIKLRKQIEEEAIVQRMEARGAMDVRAVLADAKEVLWVREWAQGYRNVSVKGPGPVCVGIAIYIAAKPWEGVRAYAIWQATCQHFRRANGIEATAEWNDAPGRTLTEVYGALNRALTAA